MNNSYRRTSQFNRSNAKPTLDELIASTTKSLDTMAMRGFSSEAIYNELEQLNLYNSLAARVGGDTKFAQVPAQVYKEALAAIQWEVN